MDSLERIDTPYGSFLSAPGDVITGQLRRYGAHQRNELAMLLAFVRPGDVVLDVGANIGTFAVPLAARVGPEGHVYAFEADQGIFEVLARNLELNGCENVTATNAIVSRKRGGYRKSQPSENLGKTSFHFDPSADGEGVPVLSVEEWYESAATVARRIDVIKIDVEGMDADALYSCEGIVRRHEPIVFIEIAMIQLREHGSSEEQIERLLRRAGYHFFWNAGSRNSRRDSYRLARLPSLSVGGGFFDLLAVHSRSERYPRHARGEAFSRLWRLAKGIRLRLRRTARLPRRAGGFLRRRLLDSRRPA